LRDVEKTTRKGEGLAGETCASLKAEYYERIPAKRWLYAYNKRQ